MLDLAALIITFNERDNIGRTLSQLAWIREVVVVDSFSTDGTLEILMSFPNVRVVQHPFESFAKQCNYGLSVMTSAWVLSLDADYVLTPEISAAIQAVADNAECTGFAARFRYCVGGRPLRSTLYPPRTVLYRRDAAEYYDEGHGHRVRIRGTVGMLPGFIDHDDRKPLSRWIRAQDRYAEVEAKHLLAQPPETLAKQDRLRLQIFYAPAVVALYLLVVRGLVMDGWRGWYYVCQRTIAELLLSLRLLTEKYGVEAAHEAEG